MGYLISAYSKDAYKDYCLPSRTEGDHKVILPASIFNTGSDIRVELDCIGGVWHICEGEGYRAYKEKQPLKKSPLQNGDIVTLAMDGGAMISLLVSKGADILKVYEKYDISRLTEITIGSAPGNAVCCVYRRLVSQRHARLVRETDGWYLEDMSRNGIFLGSRRVRGKVPLHFGDCINIFDMRLVFLSGVLAIDCSNPALRLDPNIFVKYAPPASSPVPAAAKYNKAFFKRSVRTMDTLETEPVEIEGPPAPNRQKKQPLFMAIGPAFTMMIPMLLGTGVAIFASSQAGGSASPYMFTGIITAIAAALIGVMWALINLRYGKKALKEDEALRLKLYGEYLENTENSIKEKYQRNTAILHERYPSAAECCRAGAPTARLWNRNFSHKDFLYVRLGIGSLPFQTPIVIPKEKFTLVADDLAERPAKIMKSYETLQNVPVGIDLMEKRLVGVFGGGNRSGVISVARSMALQIAASNSYTDVKLVFIYDKKDEAQWSFAKWLPHVWSEDSRLRYVAENETQASDVFYALASVIRLRAENDSSKKGDRVKPHYVVFIDCPELLEKEPVAKYLFEPKDEYGVTTLLLADSREELSNACRDMIENSSEFSGMYDVGTPDDKRGFIAFDAVSPDAAEGYARALSRVKINEIETGGELVDSLTFFDMYGVSSLEELGVLDRWRKNKTYENMRALVGWKAGGQNTYLDIHEKYHGPHGLVAGTTGSGKSETLQTYMLSLALNFSPGDVAFLVIDFKGGGMANLFAGLPHIAGQITNLSGNQVRRAMVSIKSEIKRRQRIFGEYDVNHLDMYTRLVKSGEAKIPVPHLIIVVDEFAELKREEPDFMRELISVAQVGRSLGIHLILATQKPAGVVDDNIWSNSRFRLCLRVQDRQDSADMLKKPDAAYITRAGRCYMQVGNDEIYELFQSGWSGASYDEDRSGRQELARMLTLTGRPVLIGSISKLRKKEQKQQRWLTVLMEETVLAARVLGADLSALKIDSELAEKAMSRVFARLAARGRDFQDTPHNRKCFWDFISVAPEGMDGLSGQEFSETVKKQAAAAFVRGLKLPEEKERTQLAAVAEYIAQRAREAEITGGASLWLPPLPERLCLSDLSPLPVEGGVKKGAEWSMKAMLGLLDDPVNQAQRPLVIDLARSGHTALCGMVMSGKSTFVQTFVYSLVSRYTPDELSIYMLDYSARTAAVFEGLPHVGGVVFEDDTEKQRKFFTMLSRELERRKKKFSGGGFEQYIRANGPAEPAMLIVLDGYANFKEKTDNIYEPELTSLSRDGASYGMFLFITSGGFGAAEIQSRIGDNIKTTLSLQMGDKFKYADVLRTTHIDILPENDVRGRGLIIEDGGVLEFQTALAIDMEDDYSRMEAMRAEFADIDSKWTGRRARRIPQIPAEPTWELFSAEPSFADVCAEGRLLPAGYREEDAELFGAELERIFTYVIAGRRRTGKTSALRGFIRSAAAMKASSFILDFREDELALEAKNAGAKYVSTDDELSGFASGLLAIMKERNSLKKQLKSEGLYDEMIQERMSAEYAPVFIFIADLADFVKRVYTRSEKLPDTSGFFENFFDKGSLHNIYVFAAMPLEEYSQTIGRRVFDLIISRKAGMLLGGAAAEQRLFEFSGIPYQEQSRSFKPGLALIPAMGESGPLKVVLPLCR